MLAEVKILFMKSWDPKVYSDETYHVKPRTDIIWDNMVCVTANT
jgi:hypothetical protein